MNDSDKMDTEMATATATALMDFASLSASSASSNKELPTLNTSSIANGEEQDRALARTDLNGQQHNNKKSTISSMVMEGIGTKNQKFPMKVSAFLIFTDIVGQRRSV